MRFITLIGLVLFSVSLALADDSKKDTRPGIAPDIRDDESGLKVQRGDFVVVPIPISDPTLGSGLVAGAAYFYRQTKEQKKAQPASVTALGGMYTDNDSKAIALVQQNYWKNNTWRFTGAVGAADVRLSLLTSDASAGAQDIDWRIDGKFWFARLSRRIAGHWYGGFNLRGIDAEQSFETSVVDEASDFGLGNDIRSAGLGANIEYDSRDMPINTFSGHYFKIDALFNDESIGSDHTYQSYSFDYSSFREVSKSVVLAWEMRACLREGTVPLWDSCTVKLRGFPATDYLGTETASAQIEARWRLNDRWGFVGFAGAGMVGRSFSEARERDPIPSYGAGIRFTVLKAKRINLRIDYARSLDDDAIHIAVGEAF